MGPAPSCLGRISAPGRSTRPHRAEAHAHTLGALDAQVAAVDHQPEQIATREPWADAVAWLCSFRGISTHTALGLLAEIGDFRRSAHPGELMSYPGLSKY